MKTGNWLRLAVPFFITMTHAAERIDISAIPKGEMTLVKQTVAGFTPTAASSDSECSLAVGCLINYTITGYANDKVVIIHVSSSEDGSEVSRIDTEIELARMSRDADATLGKMAGFRADRVFESRDENGKALYLIIGFRGSTKQVVQIRADGSVIESDQTPRK